MADGWREDTFTYEIISYLGTLSVRKDGWTREANIVSWNGNPAKIDVREWNSDHTRMSRGIALTDAEGKKLYEVLKGRYE